MSRFSMVCVVSLLVSFTVLVAIPTMVCAQPRALNAAENAVVKEAIQVVKDYGSTSTADGLTQLLTAGKIQVDPQKTTGYCTLGGTILLPPVYLIGITTLYGKADLASTLVHEYRHTKQSSFSIIMSNMNSSLGGKHYAEILAWLFQVRSATDWVVKAQSKVRITTRRLNVLKIVPNRLRDLKWYDDTIKATEEAIRMRKNLGDLHNVLRRVLGDFIDNNCYGSEKALKVCKGINTTVTKQDKLNRAAITTVQTEKTALEAKAMRAFFDLFVTAIQLLEEVFDAILEEVDEHLGSLEVALPPLLEDTQTHAQEHVVSVLELFLSVVDAPTSNVELLLLTDCTEPSAEPVVLCFPDLGDSPQECMSGGCSVTEVVVILPETSLLQVLEASDQQWRGMLENKLHEGAIEIYLRD